MGLFTNKTENGPWEMIHPKKKNTGRPFIKGGLLKSHRSQRFAQVGFSKESQRPMTDAEVASTRVLKLKLEDLLEVFLFLSFCGGGVAQSKSVFFEEFRV